MRIKAALPLLLVLSFTGTAHAALETGNEVRCPPDCGASGSNPPTTPPTTPPTVVTVPEPGTLGLLALGMMGLAAARRRK